MLFELSGEFVGRRITQCVGNVGDAVGGVAQQLAGEIEPSSNPVLAGREANAGGEHFAEPLVTPTVVLAELTKVSPLARVLSNLMASSTGEGGMLQTILKWLIIALFAAMGLKFMQIADEIVVIAFAAILGSAAVFGVFHFFLFKFPVTALLGVMLAYLCWRSRSILPAIIAHLLHNGLGVLTAFYPQWQSSLGINHEEEWAHLPATVLVETKTDTFG